MTDAPPKADLLLDMRGITKSFSGVPALEEVDFGLRRGEVHALIGENGAGKSTLMNVLAGRFGDYTGQITFDGTATRVTSPRQALKMGVAIIYQELSVLSNFTVAENIMLGDEKAGRWSRRIDRSTLRAEAGKIIKRLGFDLDPDEPVARMSTARQCLVEIAGALRRQARVLVFDEPTASLGGEDVEKLFVVICELKSKGLGIVYISHRLAELPQIADRVTVLRDGRAVGTRSMAECRLPDLTRMMLGHELAEMFPAKHNRPGEVVLTVEGLTRPGVFEDVSFELRAGEILGLAGLVGSGRTEIARAIFGADKAAGTVTFRGRPVRPRSPGRCRRLGIAMVPENRKVQGNITDLSVCQNITMGVLGRLSGRAGWLRPRTMRNAAMGLIDKMRVQPPDPDRPIQQLSGGNQQKAIVARWLAPAPKVLIFDEPTQGIDVGTKAQLYRLMVDLAAQGNGILLISSEFIELVKLADRILVVRSGRIAAELPGGDTDEEALFAACVEGPA